MPSSDFSTVLVKDDRIANITDKITYAVNKGAQQVTVAEFNATSESNSSHVFHQYTMKISGGNRDALKNHLDQAGIPAMIYYPVSLNEQEAYKSIGRVVGNLDVTRNLCNSVLSIPMHTELSDEQINYISNSIINFFRND